MRSMKEAKTSIIHKLLAFILAKATLFEMQDLFSIVTYFGIL